MRHTDQFVYQVLPGFEPEELIERDIDRITEELYNLPFEEVLGFMDKVSAARSSCPELLKSLGEVWRRRAMAADLYIDFSFTSLGYLLNPEAGPEKVDDELSNFENKGSRFLNNWVEVSDEIQPGSTSTISPDETKATSGDCEHPERMYIRAMPTRQLHLTAGNAPAIRKVTLFNENICLGCGECIGSCPEDALRLIHRPAWEEPEESYGHMVADMLAGKLRPGLGIPIKNLPGKDYIANAMNKMGDD